MRGKKDLNIQFIKSSIVGTNNLINRLHFLIFLLVASEIIISFIRCRATAAAAVFEHVIHL